MPAVKESRAPEPAATQPAFARALAIVACVLAFLAYLRAFSFGFVFDDHDQIQFNGAIQSWRHFGSLFTHHVWAFNDPNFAGNYWRPLFLVWLLINHTLFALKPAGWHIAGVLLHVAVTWLVYRLTLRLTRDAWTAAFAALLFAVDPIHLEAVTWVSGATDSLMALFFLGSLLGWFRYRDESRTLWVAASLLLYAAALLSKETGIVLVAIIPLAAWLFAPAELQTSRLRSTMRATAPYAAVTAAYLVCRLLTLRGMAHPLGGEPITAMVLTWPSMLWFYARQLLLPVGLSGFYDVAVVESPGLMSVFVPLVALAAIFIGLAYWSRRAAQPVIAFCAAWMLVALLPVLYIRVFPSWDIVHDRYLYLPSVGFVILVAFAIRQIKSAKESFGIPQSQIVAIAVIAILYCASGIADQGAWATDYTLYRRGFAVAPDNLTPKVDLAIIMIRNEEDAPRAAELLREALAKSPDLYEANYNLGYLYFVSGADRDAETYLTRSINTRPWEAPQYAYRSMSRMRLGELDTAAEDARRALQLTPDAKRFHYAYGLILEKQGHPEGAAAEFEAELKLFPGDTTVEEALARVRKR